MSAAKGGQRISSPTGRSGGTKSPFLGDIHDIIGPYLMTLHRNK
jgi:hypothetical protein